MRRLFRIMFLLMAMMVAVNPVAGAESTPQAEPVVTEVPADEAQSPVDHERDAPGSDDMATEDASPMGSPAAEETTQTRQHSLEVEAQQLAVGTLVVTVVGSNPDHPVPPGAFVCVSDVWMCDTWYGEPLTFTVPAGDYIVSFDMWEDSYYTDTLMPVSVLTGETVDVTLTLEPRQPGTLRLFISTDTAAPVPAGTVACVQQDATDYTDAIDTCLPVESGVVDFVVNEGWVDVSVVTPDGSGFYGTSAQVWATGGTVSREYLVLEDDADAVVIIDVATEDGQILNGHPSVCLQRVNTSLGHCQWVSIPTYDNDGGFNYEYHVPEGTWTWVVSPSMHDASRYLPVSGTVTVAFGDEITIEATLPLRSENDEARVTVDVITFGGEPAPNGTVVCVTDDLMEGPECRAWNGDLQDYQVAAGNVIVDVQAPDESGYSDFFTVMPLVPTGDQILVQAILYPLDLPLTMQVEVSDPEPQAGDLVTFWLTARGPGFEFVIEDVLPDALTDVSIWCSGEYTSLLPGGCAEIVNGTMMVPGFARNGEFIDMTIHVTGTIVGEPGTEITNQACVTVFHWTGNEIACDAASLRIAGGVEPVPTETPDATPDPGEIPDPTETPVVTPDPVDPEEGDEAAATPETRVTKLPSTGTEPVSGSSLAAATALIAAMMLAGAGVLRARHR